MLPEVHTHGTPHPHSYSPSACLLFPLFSFSIVRLTEYPVGGRTTQRRALPSDFETLQFVYSGWNILLEDKEPHTHADQLYNNHFAGSSVSIAILILQFVCFLILLLRVLKD